GSMEVRWSFRGGLMMTARWTKSDGKAHQVRTSCQQRWLKGLFGASFSSFSGGSSGGTGMRR
ncbi:hypothetical protein U1Q18_031398, partial [Sarracenia purpurea var. burkii]